MHIPTYLGLTMIGILSLSLAVSSLTLAQDPTREPPLDNVSPPLNTSSSSQVKTGGLSVGSLGVEGGLWVGEVDKHVRISSDRISFPPILPITTYANGNVRYESTSLNPNRLKLDSWEKSSGGELLRTADLQLGTQNVYFRRRDSDGQITEWSSYGTTNLSLNDYTRISRPNLNLSTSSLDFRYAIREYPWGSPTRNRISSNARIFEIHLNNNSFSDAGSDSYDIFLGIRREPSSYSSIFYMFSPETGSDIHNYKARLGINTQYPLYPLDVRVSSTTAEPWVAGFGYDSLVKIAADGRVAANQYCDSAGNNCVDLEEQENKVADLESTIETLENRIQALENANGG